MARLTLRKPPMPTEMSTPEKLRLCEGQVTLNGEPAQVSGLYMPFAKVTSLVTGLHCEFSWQAVARVRAKGGAFSSM